MRSGVQRDRGGATPMPSASTRKVSIMMALLRKAHAGAVDLDEPCIVTEALKHEVASGTLRYMAPGLTITLRDAMIQMIILSDNVCTKMVLARLSLDELNDFCAAAGMTGTVHRFIIPPLGIAYDHPADAVTTTTADDQVRLLGLIEAGRSDPAVAATIGCSPPLCQFAIDVLSWQIFKQMIPALLPWGTKVANKTGRGRRGRMDVGMVFRDDRPLYTLAAYTRSGCRKCCRTGCLGTAPRIRPSLGCRAPVGRRFDSRRYDIEAPGPDRAGTGDDGVRRRQIRHPAVDQHRRRPSLGRSTRLDPTTSSYLITMK